MEENNPTISINHIHLLQTFPHNLYKQTIDNDSTLNPATYQKQNVEKNKQKYRNVFLQRNTPARLGNSSGKGTSTEKSIELSLR